MLDALTEKNGVLRRKKNMAGKGKDFNFHGCFKIKAEQLWQKSLGLVALFENSQRQ